MAVVALVAELVLRSTAAALLVSAVAILAVALARAIGARAPASVALRGLAVAVCGAWILTVAFHVLIAVHGFRLAVVLPLFAVSAFLVRRAGGGRLPSELVARWWRSGARRRPAFLAGTIVFAILATRALFVPPVSWDTLTYHLVKAAVWVQSGGPIALRAPGGGGLYLNVPGNVDALWAWAMLPFHSDLLVGVADVGTLFLLGASAYVLGRALGARAPVAAIGAAFVVSLPSALMAAGSNYVDNMVAFDLTAAAAFALRSLRRREPAWAILAAMTGGLAAGAKLTAVSLLVVLLATVAWRVFTAGPRSSRLSVIALAVAAALVVAVPSYLRTWVATGHPFSPYSVRVAGLVLGESADADWYAKLPPPATPYTLEAEWPALRSMFHDPFSNTLGPLAALPILILPASLFWLWRRRKAEALLLGALLAANLHMYLAPAYAVTRLGWARMSGRYFLHPIAIAVALGLAAFPRAPLTTVLVLAAALNIWFHGGLYWTGLELTLVGSYLSVLAVAIALAARFSGNARRVAAAVLALVCLGVGQAGRDLFRSELAANAIVTHEAPRFPAHLLAYLNGGQERTLAFTSGPLQTADNWIVYPFLGSRLQNTPVYVPISRSGRVIPHPDPEYLKDVDVDAWLSRLEGRHVDIVVSFSPPGPELAWMEARPRAFLRLAGDGSDWGAYQRSAQP